MKDPSVNAPSVAIPFEDAELVEQCRRGDNAAFGRLVVKYQDRVFNTCWRMCGNRADAEDLTQEAFVRALQSIDRFGGRSKFYTWVFRIAVNLVISARRMNRRTTTYSLDASYDAARHGESHPAGPQLAAGDESPDQHASTREHQALVLDALESLDEEQRAVVILRDLESFAYDEIAEILEVPPGTVKSRLHRARLALRQTLSPILASSSAARP
ncbi:MAG: sigma-70 family RNA polymerase sigma factor [Phycisphaerae bacterium]|nr:sigma-70 family RNA polymerase sigma factor [Phycisphaerae bacterium]